MYRKQQSIDHGMNFGKLGLLCCMISRIWAPWNTNEHASQELHIHLFIILVRSEDADCISNWTPLIIHQCCQVLVNIRCRKRGKEGSCCSDYLFPQSTQLLAMLSWPGKPYFRWTCWSLDILILRRVKTIYCVHKIIEEYSENLLYGLWILEPFYAEASKGILNKDVSTLPGVQLRNSIFINIMQN